MQFGFIDWWNTFFDQYHSKKVLYTIRIIFWSQAYLVWYEFILEVPPPPHYQKLYQTVICLRNFYLFHWIFIKHMNECSLFTENVMFDVLKKTSYLYIRENAQHYCFYMVSTFFSSLEKKWFSHKSKFDEARLETIVSALFILTRSERLIKRFSRHTLSAVE